MNNVEIMTFVKKVALFLPLLLLVMGVNLFVDPAHLFGRNEYERAISRHLANKLNVANISDYDERLLQKFYIETLAKPADVIVLGSSRAMQLGQGLFPGLTVFNNCVSGATIEDDIAIFQMYHEKRLHPSTVVLCVDPWILNCNNQQLRWQVLSDKYGQGERFLNLSPSSDRPEGGIAQGGLRKWFELISPAYFQQSLGRLKALIFEPQKATGNCFATSLTMCDSMVRLADGTINYDLPYRTRPVSQVRSLARAFAAEKPVYSLGSFAELDGALERKLEAFVDALQSLGIKVVFLMVPYHPDAYQALAASPQYKIILDAQKYFEQLAAVKHIQLIGSYDPDKCACQDSDFFDGMHPKREAIEKLYRSSTPKGSN